MKTTLTEESLAPVAARLAEANAAFVRVFPGEPEGRQPIHTVYGGAQLFRADVPKKLGTTALRALEENAPDFATFGRALRLPGWEALPEEAARITDLRAALVRDPDAVRAANRGAWLADIILKRVVAKLEREPVEDFRIDFEDGFGVRPDKEEDETAVADAKEVARGLADGILPPFIGIRIKSLAEETRSTRAPNARSLRGRHSLPRRKEGCRRTFVVFDALPKVTIPEHVAATVSVFRSARARPRSPCRLAEDGADDRDDPIDPRRGRGRVNLPRLLAAARGRCVGAHFGTYDYTAGCNITAAFQTMMHPACDFARHTMQVSFARTGIFLSDGATNVMPVPVHRGENLSLAARVENRASVHAAWRLQLQHIEDSLMRGLYQGWDLHPAQLPIRYAAVYAFFLRGLDAAGDRLKNFVEKAAQATLVGDVFDDAATGQGLLNYFLRAINSGAVSEDEVLRRTGLELEEVRLRSFVKILEHRKTRVAGK